MKMAVVKFDSDVIMLTNNSLLISKAKINYNNFAVPTKRVKSNNTPRKYNADGLSDLDIKTSVNKIGEIINLSQEINSKIWEYLYHNPGDIDGVQEYYKDCSQLDVMSNLEIDSAKKENPADNVAELKLLKNKYRLLGIPKPDKDDRYVRPMFFKHLDKEKGFYDPDRKTYQWFNTSMDYLQKHIDKYRSPVHPKSYYSLCKILEPRSELSGKRISYPQINTIIGIVKDLWNGIKAIYTSYALTKQEKFLLASDKRSVAIEEISKIKLGEKTFQRLLQTLEDDEYSEIHGLLFSILFSAPHEMLYNVLKKAQDKVGVLQEIKGGDIKIYDFSYKIV